MTLHTITAAELPSKINRRALVAELKAAHPSIRVDLSNVYGSTKTPRDSDGNELAPVTIEPSIIAKLPNGVDIADIKATVAAHNPDDSDEDEQSLRSEFSDIELYKFLKQAKQKIKQLEQRVRALEGK